MTKDLWRDIQKLWGASRIYASGIVLASVWIGIVPHLFFMRVTDVYFKLDGAIGLGIWTSDLTVFMWWTVLFVALGAAALQFILLLRGLAKTTSHQIIFAAFFLLLLVNVFQLTPVFGLSILVLGLCIYSVKQVYIRLALPYIAILLFLGFFANRLTNMTQRLVDGDTIFFWLFEVLSVIGVLIWFSTNREQKKTG